MTVVLCTGMLLAGCGSEQTAKEGSAGDGKGDAGKSDGLKVALILSGPANDQGWKD